MAEDRAKVDEDLEEATAKFAFDFVEVILHSHLNRDYVDRVLRKMNDAMKRGD